MTQSCLRKKLVCRLTCLSLAVVSYLATGGTARAVNLVQEFYLPMPEAQISQANNAIISGSAGAINSTFSIIVTGSGTVIYYDQWEDGYETDLSNPTQASTQIWGDGNDAHGIPPGFAHNPLGLPAGTVITLTNSVSLPRNPSSFLFDGRDRIAATKAVVVTRAGWPTSIGPVFAGAVSVLSTMDYGTNYLSPVGQDLSNNLFKYVGLFVMAAQNNTAVMIDPNGNGIGITNIVLNQGESYLVNGGVKKGGRVTATKPVQADLIIGHVGASYASDWFTLYPVEEWSSSYYTPVSSAASGSQPAYVYLFNPNTNAIVVNYATKSGSGSFSVAGTNGVQQFQMPIGSGASFVSAGGQSFFALCTVAANPSADTAYNWGFTLVPQTALTTEAVVGWAPGSADGSVDGSPVWVTALANTTLYVDYKGDHLGPLLDTNNGTHYDTNFTLTALQSQKIYDPSKNQTGMRVYTVDGTLLTAAWGEDPDVAQPGNPYIDAGTTVLPFPVPALKKTAAIINDVAPTNLSVGDTIAYTVEVDNKGLLPLGNTVVVDAPSTNLTYLTNSTTWNGAPVPDSVSGTPFPLDAPGFIIPVILSRGTSTFTYQCKVNASGVVSNGVNITGTAISADTALPPAPTNGASVSLNFTDGSGQPTGFYFIGASVFVTMTNAVFTSNTLQTINVTVTDTNTGDAETIPLVETGTNTGVFRNVGGLSSSPTSGLVAQDGTLCVKAGDTLSVSYTDPVYLDSGSATAVMQFPSPNKQLYLTANGTPGNQFLNRINPVATAGHGTTYTSTDIGSSSGGGPGTVALVSFTTNGTSKNLVWTNVINAAPNTLLLVGINYGKGNGSVVTNVIYGAANMTLVSSRQSAAQFPVSSIWQMVNPPAGTNKVTIQVQVTGTFETLYAVAATFTGVNTNLPLSAPTIVTNAATASLTNIIFSVTNGMVFDVAAADVANPTNAGPNQTVFYKYGDGNEGGGASYRVGAATVTNIWRWAAPQANVDVAVTINPSTNGASGGGGPATNTTSFAQTPVLALPFTLPAGGAVSITNYITLTNGTFSANPNVTAMLQSNGVNFLTLTNPVFTASGGITNLVWSGTLATNFTLPAGATISYVVSNAVAGTAFHVNYDSTNSPSQIVLPAATVIAFSGFAVYDAPYPNGNLVTTPSAGTTLYVRASVTDPFGSYDITSLGLAFTAPNTNNNFNVTLTNPNVVFTNASTLTYEYIWNTGPATGNYAIAATANEGTEGVKANATAGITTIFLDLGTPSTTEFTGGNNGPATNSYPASGSGSVCVRVTDLNRNTNSATGQNILATLTSSAGDTENITLVETGTNTGIFTACITTSTNLGTAPFDNTLYAPVGSVLTANYSDPTDPTDNTSATATITPLPGVAGVRMNKTLVSPTGGQVGLGQPVTYNLQVVNTGSTSLTNVVVTDNFPSAKLSYTTASQTPTTVAAGVLTWTNLGAFMPGQSTNFTVTFTALATGSTTNFATANGGTATNSSSVTMLVTHAALTVGKILLSPASTPVDIGSNVVFRITIQNSGDTVIPLLPFEDNYSGAYYQYVSATIPPNGSGAGSLIWTNLAYPTPLATNAIITNDITMKIVGAGSPANNTAVADYAVDIFGNPVPVANTTTGIVTIAASILGHVYNDINHNGVFTNGDAGLGNVTLQLFTDPNGDGNPADGALVQIVTTDANGYYELLNLPTGHYVVQENDLPGYANSVPANGRLALNLTTLTAAANNNFFQYQPSSSSYSTLSGTVWNDVNGNGTNDPGEPGLANIELDLVQDVNTNGLADAAEPVAASVLTDANGNYSFAGITPGNYVVRETDLYGYYNTGDSQPPNDGQVAISASGGATFTNVWFLEHLNQPPTASNDVFAAAENVPTTLYPLANDTDPDGNPLTITVVTTTNGTVDFANGTNVIFTPDTNFLGTLTLNYSISDGHGGTASASIFVTVTNVPPAANPDFYRVAENTTNTLSPLTNDVVLTPGGSLTILGVSATNGVATISGTNVIFTPPLNFVGIATIGYVITDHVGGTNNSLITVTVTNLPPTAFGQAVATTENTAKGIALTGSDPTSLPLTFIIVAGPTNGTLTSINTNTGAVTYTPNVNYTGADTFTFQVNNGYNSSPVVSVGITVANIPPLANPDSVTVLENSTNTFAPLTNDLVRTPGGTLQIIGVSPTNGTATILNLTNVVFTPSSNFVGTATIGYMITDGIGGTNSSVITVTVQSVADLAVSKSGPAGVYAAANFNYTITVTNLGPGAAVNLSVTDNLPATAALVSSTAGATLNGGQLVWTNLGSLAANAATNLTVTVTAPVTGISLTNLASAGSPTSDPTPTNNISLPVITSVTPIADLIIAKTGPGFVLATSNVLYTISVTNLGPSSASGVVVTDALPTGVTFVNASGSGVNNSGVVNWNLGALASGQATNLTVTVIAPASGSLTNIASVNSPTTDTNLLNNVTPPVVTTVGSVADLAIGKTAATSVFAVSNLTYTISVTNFGPSTASSVTVTDSIPNGASFVSASGGGANNSGIVIWNLGNLANSAASNVTLTVTAPASGTLTNFATAGSPTGDPNPTNNVTPPVLTSVTLLADLVIAKTGPANVFAASNCSYTISVTNLGPSSASAVVVTDSLPIGVTFVNASGNGSNNAGVVNWNLGALTAGQASNLTVTVTAPASGTLTNLASVSSPTGDTNILNNTTPPVITSVTQLADVSVLKTGPAGIVFGTNFNYTITVSNAGPSTAASLSVTDSLPTGLVYVSAVPATTTNASNQVIWNLGNFAAGTGSNLTLTVISTVRGSVTNVATGGSPTPDPVPTNNAAPPVVTAVTNNPPSANPDSYAVTENTTNLFSPLLNDVVQTPGGSLTIVFVSSTNGSVSILNGTNIVFTPANNFLGTATLGYTITDNVGGTSSSFISVLVTNIPPVANPDSYAVTENMTNAFAVLVNDLVQTPGGSLTLLSVTTTNGVATVSGTNIVFTPSVNYRGNLTLNYFVTDKIGGTNNSFVTVLVTNIPPLANPDAYTVAENTTNTFAPLVNDSAQTPGGVLQIIGVSPTNGTATILNLTNVVFTPASNFVGTATIGYTITDGIGGTNSSLITVTVTNLPPTAFGQSVATTENIALPITLAGSDPAGRPLTFAIVNGPVGGTLTGLNTNTGGVTYTPTNNFTGTDTFTFRVNDGYSDSATATISIAVTPTADLLVAQSGPASGVAGANLVFTVAVTNLGSASATNVIVTNQIAGGYTFVSASSAGVSNGNLVMWTIPVLPANGATNLTVTLFAVEGGTFTNTASGISLTPDLNAANNNGSQTNAQVITSVSALADVAVFKSGNTSVLADGTVNYSILATNFGPSTASNVVVSDSLPAGTTLVNASGNYSVNNGVITWPAGNLPGGAATNFTVTLTAPASGTLTNIAASRAGTADPNPGNNDGSSPNSAVITLVTPVADLSLGKSAAASALATSNLVYTISVTNFGPSTASSVTVTDAIPNGASYVRASGGGVNNSGVVIWNLGDLANGVVSNVTLTVTAPASGSLTNIATVGSPTSDPSLTNNVTPPVITAVTSLADLQITKTAPASVLAMSNLTYAIAVTNFGPSSASSVVVTDSLPTGVTFVNASGNGANNSGVVSWNLGSLAAGQSSNLTVTVTASASGGLTNVATVGSPTSDPNPTNNTTPPVITSVTPLADLVIAKTGPANVFAASNCSYTISVTNLGPSSASGVVVTDSLPAGVTFVTASGNGSNNAGVVSWNLGVLASGQSSNLTVTVTAPASGTLTNLASVSSPTADTNILNNTTPPVITAVTPVADLAIGKSAAGSVLATSNLVYTISVTNFGPSTASSVTVTDNIPNGASFINASGSGLNSAGMVIWSLGNLPSGTVSNVTLTVSAPASGSLTNIATAGSPTSDPVPTNNFTPPVFTAVTPVADVAVGKSGPAGATFNTNFSYTISVTNFGPSVASGILVTDSLPAGVVFAGAVPATTTNATGQVIWSVNNLAANATTNLTLTVISTARGALTNFATVGGSTFDPSPTNNVSPPVVTLVTNIPPVANADSYVIAENSGTNTFTPLVNDVLRNPGGVLQIISVSTTNGSAVVSGTNVLFVPGTNYFGSLTLNYSITDNVGGTNSSFIIVLVTNIPPVANPDSYTIGENSGTNTFSPLINDSVRTLGGGLQIIGVNSTNGTATISGTNILFAPNANFFGVATIGYTITDGIGGTNNSLITVNVTNVPPVANSQSVGTSENTPKSITLTGIDPNHLPLTFAIVGNPANGTLSLLNTNTGTVTYTPGTNYTGADSFTFRVNNGQTNSAAATVNLSVTPVADLVVVESGPTTGLAGSNLVVTVSVTNRGPATATSLAISNQLSSGFTFVSASGAGVNSGGLVTWLVSSLPVNGVTNFTVTAFAAEGGAFTNIASGGSAVQDLNLANNNGSQVNAQSLTVITPVADVAVFKTGGTNVYVGQTVAYVITATNAGPSTATNVVVQDTLPAGAIFQSASGSFSTNSGVVTWSGVTLAPNAVATFNLTLLAPASVSSFLNIASATSPTLDPNPTNNNGTFSSSRVTTTVAPSADLVVLLSGPATSIQGSNFVYSLLVTNVGPSVSSNIVVSDIFPSNLVFVSASSGGGFTNNVITWPKILSLAVGATTNYSITAKGVNAGVFTNLASALATTYDPNPTNNTGVSPASQVQTTVGPAQFNFLAGTPTLNPQTGLYEEAVTVTNSGTVTVAGFQLYVGGLRSGVSLFNATGTNNGLPYVQYNSAVNPTNTVSLILEFYNPSRLAFTNSLSAVAILPPNTGTSGTNGSVLINRVFLDNRFTPARVVVEFGSVPGKVYTILYSTNLTAAVWKVATPTVTANANITQWYDDGPPETDSLPGPTRYYRIIQN